MDQAAPLWSILICTLAGRRDRLARLLARLLPQCEADGRVEVVAYWDTGQNHVAVKRQALLQAARGEYVSFVDDDDVVDPQFVQLVTAAMAGGADYIAFPNAYYVDGARQTVDIRGGLEYNGWTDEPGILYRDITHINPVKASIARQADISGWRERSGEDWQYTCTVRKLARTQAQASDKPLYHYFHSPSDSVQHGTQSRAALLRLDGVESPCFRWYEPEGEGL